MTQSIDILYCASTVSTQRAPGGHKTLFVTW